MAARSASGNPSFARWGTGLLVAVLLPALAAVLPATDAVGTEHWLAFEENAAPGTLSVQILGPVGTTGSVSITGLAFLAPYTIPAAGISTVTIPAGAMLTTNDGISTVAVEVTSDQPVVVYGLHIESASSDSLLALPTSSLGLDYLVKTYSAGSFETELAIVSTADATSIDITPSAAIAAHPAGVTYSVLLDRGDVYQGQSSGDLSGTEISASSRIAVFAGNTCANVPFGVCCCDHVMEQLLPVDAWTTEVVVAPSATRTAPERVRLQAAVDGTLLKYTPFLIGAPTSLNANQWAEFLLSAPLAVSSQDAAHPIEIARFATGTASDGQHGDPYQANELGTARFAYGYRIATADNGTDFPTNYVNVVAPSVAVGRIRLDGTSISPDCFAAIGTSGFSVCQQGLVVGAHRLTGPLAFGATLYGFGLSTGYASPAGGDSLPFLDGFEAGNTLDWTLTTP